MIKRENRKELNKRQKYDIINERRGNIMEKLKKSRTNRVLGGVLGGIGEHFDIDANVLRIVVFIVGLFNPFPITLLYLIASLIIPYEDPKDTETIYSKIFSEFRDKTNQENKNDRKILKDVEEK